MKYSSFIKQYQYIQQHRDNKFRCPARPHRVTVTNKVNDARREILNYPQNVTIVIGFPWNHDFANKSIM